MKDITKHCTAKLEYNTGSALVYLYDPDHEAIGLFDCNGFHPMIGDKPYRIEQGLRVHSGITWFKVLRLDN